MGGQDTSICEQIGRSAACEADMGVRAQGRWVSVILSRRERYCAEGNFGRLQRTRCCSHEDRSCETSERARQAQPAGLRPDGSELVRDVQQRA